MEAGKVAEDEDPSVEPQEWLHILGGKSRKLHCISKEEHYIVKVIQSSN